MIVCKFSITICLSLLPLCTNLATAGGLVSQWDVNFVKTVGNYLDKIVASFGQARGNANGTRNEFRDYLLEDQSNEDLGHSTPQQIISRSGYNYENHYVLSDDDYITQLIRISNPLVDPRQLKQPPVALIHGGIIDSTVWIWTSALQHHPEKYPRSMEEDGPITSWNRSLAFTLANNGYDVWLVSTRGSNSQNQGHMKYRTRKQSVRENVLAIEKDRMKYWNYTMDDIVKHELPHQIDKVLEVTGANNLSIVTISLSTQTTLALFASNKEYALKTHNYVALGPIINNKGANNLLSGLHKSLCVLAPDDLGTLVWTEGITSQPFRDLALAFTKIRKFRYSVVWAAGNLLCGPSPTYQTNLEPGVVGHLFQPIAFKEIKHYCQQVVAGKLQKFDYGMKRNWKLYGSFEPPAYNISNIHVKNWLLVSGGNDLLATTNSVQQILKTVRPRARHIFVPRFNHLDLVAGIENDIYVNLPVLQFLDKFHMSPPSSGNLPSHFPSSARSTKPRQVELDKLAPPTAPNDFVTDLKRIGFESLLSEARNLIG